MANKKYTFDDDLILIKREVVGNDKYGNAQEVKKRADNSLSGIVPLFKRILQRGNGRTKT